MSNHKQVRLSNLPARVTMAWRGRVLVSHIGKKLAGDALAGSIAAAQRYKASANSMMRIDTAERYDITITGAQVLEGIANGDPQTTRDALIYASEELYASSRGDNPRLTMKSLSNRAPIVNLGDRDDILREGHRQIVLGDRELARGLDVTIVAETYETRRAPIGTDGSIGISLRAVIVNEPIRYYQPGSGAGSMESLNAALAPLGISVDVDVPETGDDAVRTAPTETASADWVPQTAYREPAPYRPVQQAAPVQQATPVQQAAPVQQATPVQQAAPVQRDAWGTPASGPLPQTGYGAQRPAADGRGIRINVDDIQ